MRKPGNASGTHRSGSLNVPIRRRPEANHPVSNDPDYWYRQVGPNKFKSTYLKVVGGTTWHWLGTCLRFVPNDFRLRTAHGRGLDWPISYDELEPFYGEAEHEIGVAGDSGEPLGSPRSAGYPMPAIPQTFLDKAYARALAGTEYELRATPQARNSVSGNGRPACCGNASCIPICPIGAKYDATVHLSVAEKNGAVLHAQTTATRVEVGTEGRVTAIRFKRWDGSEGVARGKVFVLAAHAIETPRLLLHSRSEALPNGVANRSDQVGRNLMDHPTQLSWALSREPVWPYRGPLSTSSIENFRDGAFRKDRPAMRIEIGNDGWSWPKGAPVSTAAELARQGLRGSELNAALRRQASRHVRLASQVEQLPDPDNRVTLDPDEPDMYGVPLPRLAYRLDAYVRDRPGCRPRRARGDLRQARRHGDRAPRRAGRRRPHHGHGAHGQRSQKLGGRPRPSQPRSSPTSSSSARPCSPPAPRPIPR